MRKLIALFALVSLIISCSPTRKISNETNNHNKTSEVIEKDGTSYDKAIIIKAKSESTGVGAEYAWLSKNYPGYQSKGQSLVFQNKKPYDIIEIVTASGEEKSIYFDISNFYGKF